MAQARDMRILLGTVALAASAVFSAPSLAQTTDTLTVVATVGGECSVTGATLDFGAYTGSTKNVEVPISFECTAPTNVAISMDGGTTGDPTNRQMFNEGNTSQILYQLFRDSARTQLWGVFPEDHANFVSTTSGTPTVFGQMLGGQTPLSGSYSDSVTITLTTN